MLLVPKTGIYVKIMISQDCVARVRETKKLMAQKHISALCLLPGANMYYLTGISVNPSQRLWATIIPAEKDAVMIVPEFDRRMVEASTWIGDIRGWEESEDPYTVVSKTLNELGLTESTLGLDGKTWFLFLEKLQDTVPQARFINADPLLCDLRMTKSEAEIELIREASRIQEDAYRVGFESVRQGRTEFEILSIINSEIMSKGGKTAGTNGVLSGPVSALPHGSSGKRKIRRGDIIQFDMLCFYQGYCSDISRVCVVGTPTEEQRKIYEIVLTAQKAAINALEPGVPAEKVDKAARDKIVEAGYGRRFTHRTGHGFGLEGQEKPYVALGNKQLLRTRMTIAIEPGIYLTSQFGIRIEDNVIVREGGAENITKYNKEELLSI
jgi:Xaa-Pro dipeptidase